MNKNAPIRWILLFLIVLACLFYFVPWSTPIDLTLNATKFDQDGNEICTTQIHIYGKRLDYLFQGDRLDIELDPFDGWSTFRLATDEPTNRKGVIYASPSGRIKAICLSAAEGANSALVSLYFTDSFDHFVLEFAQADGIYFYLASVGDDHTADKVFEYFERFDFSHLPNRQG